VWEDFKAEVKNFSTIEIGIVQQATLSPKKWGQEHEAVAREAYIKHMQYHNSRKAGGFYYSPTRGMVWFIPRWNGY